MQAIEVDFGDDFCSALGGWSLAVEAFRNMLGFGHTEGSKICIHFDHLVSWMALWAISDPAETDWPRRTYTELKTVMDVLNTVLFTDHV